jgi:zinc transport system ATP-binding protein
MKEQIAVAFEKVSFSYNNHLLFKAVDLAVEEGGFVSVIGPNGGGKTTLLRLILGLLKPRSGRIRVFGEHPKNARTRIGYVAQYSSFDELFPVTALEVVLMGRMGNSLTGSYNRRDRQKALDSLAEVGLAKAGSIAFSELSGGQRQRVLIARALVTEPRLLLLDEPTSNIDVAVERKFVNVLEELHRKMTIIMVTHDVGFASHLVRNVICVNKTLAVHPTSGLTTEVINDMYGHRMNIIRHDKICTPEEDE